MSVIFTENLSRSFKTRDYAVRSKGLKGWLEKPVFKTVKAVDDLSFSIAAGEKVAFIGPNGAGKSTTLKMLCGLLRPSGGSAQVCGFVPWDKPQELSRQIGLVFGQRSHLWPALPVQDSFDLLASIYNLDQAAYAAQRNKLIEVFGLQDFLGQTARTLSLGQRMRCDIAAALLHQPAILFLDEPTIGLDVTAKALLRDHLNKLAHEFETTILLTSHDTDDIERICGRVILIDHGKKLIDTDLVSLKRDYARNKTLRLATVEAQPRYEISGVKIISQAPHQITLSVDTNIIALEQVVADCLGRFKLQDIAIEDFPLEEVIKNIYAGKSYETR